MTDYLTALFEGLSPLWEMSFTAVWVAGVVFLLRLLLKKRAPKRVLCLLWLVVFARLLIPVTLESPVSLVPPTLTEAAPARSPSLPQGGTVVQPPTPVQPTNPAGTAGPVPAVTAPAPEAATPAPASFTFSWQALLAGIWLAGTAGMLCCGVVSYLRLRRRVRFAVRVSGRVWEDENVSSPFILGFFRPRVYLPAGLEGDARGYILCHEFAHLRRFDHIVKPVCWLALALHWFNPAVWAAFLLLGRDMEGACDEEVLRRLGSGVKADYSCALLAMASGKRPPAPCPLAFDEGDAKGRIKHVLSYRRPALWIIVASVVAVIVAAVCLLTDPVTAEEEPADPPSPAESAPGPSAEQSPTPAGDLNDLLDPWMLEVLRGERTFSVNDTDRDIDHLAEAFFGGEPPEDLGLTFKLAIIDLDRDESRELVLCPQGGYDGTLVYQTGCLILRQEGDVVRGYTPGWRYFGSLKSDGTFSWSNSAFEGGTGRAHFEGGEFTMEPITWVVDGSFFVENKPATQKEYDGAIAAQDAMPEPFWYTFEDGALRGRVSIPVDDNIVVPDFLTAEQQLLYRQAEALYTTLFGPNTENIDWWPGPYDLPPAEPVEVDGMTYTPATGLFARWDDLEAAALSVFTPEFWDSRNHRQNDDGSTYSIYTNVDGRTYYLPRGRGNDGTNPNFPNTFEVTRQTDSEIAFTVRGYYSEVRPLEGESYEERDARIADHWEEYIDYSLHLVLTENGWRFDEYHSAETDYSQGVYSGQAVPNPDLEQTGLDVVSLIREETFAYPNTVWNMTPEAVLLALGLDGEQFRQAVETEGEGFTDWVYVVEGGELSGLTCDVYFWFREYDEYSERGRPGLKSVTWVFDKEADLEPLRRDIEGTLGGPARAHREEPILYWDSEEKLAQYIDAGLAEELEAKYGSAWEQMGNEAAATLVLVDGPSTALPMATLPAVTAGAKMVILSSSAADVTQAGDGLGG